METPQMNNVRQDRLAHILRYLDKEEDAAVSWRHRVFFHVLEWEFHEQAEKSPCLWWRK